MRGLRERGLGLLDLSVARLARDVAGRGRPHERRAGLQRIVDVGHAGQRLVVDDDRLGGIARLVAGLGDDRRDRFADEAHGVDRERVLRRRGGLRSVGALEVGRLQQRLDAGANELLAGDDRDDARHRSCGR